MAKFYAWSNFSTEFDEYGRATKKVAVGEEVTRDSLGVDQETWNEFVERGIVSEEPYPDIPAGISPREYYESSDAVELASIKAKEAEEAHAQHEAAAKAEQEQAKQAQAQPAQQASKPAEKKE